MIEWIKRKADSWLKQDKADTWKEQDNTSYTQRDMFFANMSHEIRTPVNGIVGFTQLLKETKLDKEQDELVNTIHSSSMHLLGLVNDILDFSKINAHKMILEETIFDLFRQVEDTIESYAAAAEEKGIALQLYTEPEIAPMLVGDPGKLSQVLINLVSNAIKFTDALGRVDVTVEKVMEGQKMVTLRFAVKDNGIGISRGAQKNIFNAFAQANSSISRKFGGTGLGLAISSELVKLMGGELVVESVPDEGSEFSFTLSFEKVRSEERRVYAGLYRGLDAGIILSHKGAPGGSEENLRRYLTYLGIDVHFYSSVEIVAMDKKMLPALLFANNSLAAAVQGGLSGMDTKMILISSINRRKSTSAGDTKHCGSIFKPLNLTKTIRALEECLDDASASEETVPTVNRNFKGYRALVVDDNVVNQKLMMRVLENMQMDVEVAFNGKEALSCCQDTHFDIVFMDIQMPVMDGVEAAKKIVAWEQAQKMEHTPIIALTGNTESKETQRYIDAGMDGFMTKPFDMDIMLSYLNTYTVGRKLMYQIERSQIVFNGAKALIVEENSIDQRLIERALASKGVGSTLIGRASLLLDAYKEDTYHIIFISAGMPRISASALIQEIRIYEAEKGLNAVPVVTIVSDGASEAECGEYREAGADGCLYRPLEIDEIKQELERCITYTSESLGRPEEKSAEILAFLKNTVSSLPAAAKVSEENLLSPAQQQKAGEDRMDAVVSKADEPHDTQEALPELQEDRDIHPAEEATAKEEDAVFSGEEKQSNIEKILQEPSRDTDVYDATETETREAEEDLSVTGDLAAEQGSMLPKEMKPILEADKKTELVENEAQSPLPEPEEFVAPESSEGDMESPDKEERAEILEEYPETKREIPHKDTSVHETVSLEESEETGVTEESTESKTTAGEVEIVKIGETRHVVQYIEI